MESEFSSITAICCCLSSEGVLQIADRKTSLKKKSKLISLTLIFFFFAKPLASICSLIFFPVIPGRHKIFVKDKKLPSGHLSFYFPSCNVIHFEYQFMLSV